MNIAYWGRGRHGEEEVFFGEPAGLLIWRKRRTLAAIGIVRPVVTGANQEWALDLVHDAAENGRKFRVTSLIDVYTRELEKALERGVPEAIRCDSEPEFTSRHFLAWGVERK